MSTNDPRISTHSRTDFHTCHHTWTTHSLIINITTGNVAAVCYYQKHYWTKRNHAARTSFSYMHVMEINTINSINLGCLFDHIILIIY